MYRYRVSEVRLGIREDKNNLINKLAKKIRTNKKNIKDLKIIRESVDARKKPDIKLVYTLDFSSDLKLDLPIAPNMDYIFPNKNLGPDKKVVVVGFGPAGMFAGLLLAQMGYKPLVIERGQDVDTRTKDVEDFWKGGDLKEDSNVQFGEGGAGAFSDGKLTTGISDPRINKVLQELYKFGGPEEILYKHKPHIGTDLLKGIVKNIRKEIISLGGQVLFSTKLIDFVLDDDLIKEIIVERNGNRESLSCHKVVIAIGHSARDTFKVLFDRNVEIVQKHFSMGLRIEHPQELINISQYGNEDHIDILGAADYKLNYRTKENRGVYTFCMCPGGEVILSSSSKGQVLSNGMSYHKRESKYANSGILVDVRKEDFESDHPLAGVWFQEKYEKKAFELSKGYKLLETTTGEFKNSDLSMALPGFVVDSIIEALPNMGRKLKGFDSLDTRLKGPETRSSSPIRILRDEGYKSNIKNLYPCGEGAGYAGGIMSAAVDGLKTAEKIIEDK